MFLDFSMRELENRKEFEKFTILCMYNHKNNRLKRKPEQKLENTLR